MSGSKILRMNLDLVPRARRDGVQGQDETNVCDGVKVAFDMGTVSQPRSLVVMRHDPCIDPSLILVPLELSQQLSDSDFETFYVDVVPDA